MGGVLDVGKTMGGVLDAGNQIQIPTTQNCDSTNAAVFTV